MKTRQGVIAVLLKPTNSHYRFAVFRRTLNWEGWELVKGGVEDDEGEEKAVKREIEEEAGIKEDEIVELSPMDGRVQWSYQRNQTKIKADYKPFLVKVPAQTKIKLPESNDEHSQGLFLNYRDARDILAFDNNRQLITRAREILEETSS